MGAYYARVLGKDAFGNISVVQAILMYFNIITLFGLHTFGTREISKNEKKSETIVNNIVSLRLVISIICYLIIILITIFINKGVEFNHILLLYGLSIFPLVFTLDWYFSGIQEMQYNAVYNIVKNFIPFVLIFIFLHESKDAVLIPIFVTIGVLCAAIYHLFIYHKISKKSIKFNINKNSLVCYAKYSFPFFISQVLSMINNYADRLVIYFTRTSAETGVYSSSYYIIFFLMNIIAMFFTPIFPLFINYYHNKENDRMDKLNNNVAKYVILTVFPIVSGGVILAKQIIVLLFKDSYMDAYIPFRILLFYILLLFIREIFGYQLNAWHKEKQYLKIVGISALINLILNLLITPKYGMIAASCITLFSEIFNLILMRREASKLYKVHCLKYIVKSVPLVVIMCIVIIILKHFNVNVIINIVFAILVYFLAAFAFKVITMNEIKKLFTKKEV